MTFRFCIMTAAILFGLSGCGDDVPQQKGPTATAELVRDNGKNSGTSFKTVMTIANNAAELSCIELTVGSLNAMALTMVSDARIVKASDATRKISGAIGKSASAKIAREEKYHCDRGAAMAGYEIFERRLHLQKTKHNRRLNQSLISYYPKDASGNPRFLEVGEKISRSILNQLPAPYENKRFDDCGRLCKAARKRTNAKAVAAGKPEPFPNLEYPRKPTRAQDGL